MVTNNKGIDLIKHYESLHDGDLKRAGLQPKLDPVGIWTEGWGRAMIDPLTKKFLRGANNKNRAYELQTIRSILEADAALRLDLASYEAEVYRMMSNGKYFFNDNQFSALVSMAYNAGGAAVMKTIPRVFNKTPEEVMKAFCMYNKGRVNGQLVELRGLTFRRKTEATLFSTGELKFFN